MTATSDTIGESQPTGDNCRKSQLEAVKDNPLRAPTTQRPFRLSLKLQGSYRAAQPSCLPMQWVRPDVGAGGLPRRLSDGPP